MISFRDFLTNAQPNIYPQGVYISLKMTKDSFIEVRNYVKEHIPYLDFNEDQHLTLIYSKKPFQGFIDTKDYVVTTKFLNFNKFDDNKVLVAEVYNPEINKRVKELTYKYGFISDYEVFKPHFTLSYNAENVDIDNLPPIDFDILFENEQAEKLNLNWEEKTNG